MFEIILFKVYVKSSSSSAESPPQSRSICRFRTLSIVSLALYAFAVRVIPVSYTHLDVYKRQALAMERSCRWPWLKFAPSPVSMVS